ncbi:hypothetical protein [Pseudooceanicola sp. HF7]|uniref:hypothetical protein n=1 Tax=Pseudooceanicola sp. HF7 TaxID=2721560 RepID=UPI00142FF163|nr:hypothetical protein [Pseudooceanicola sp. HF7]NIZ11158.1 hypothetical protein [Pseudooceanicola sp. HF7]
MADKTPPDPATGQPDALLSSGTEALSIRAVMAVPGGGRCILAGFPGLSSGVDGSSYMDPEILSATLDWCRAAGASRCLALPEAKELPEGALPLLAAGLERCGIALSHHPIRDYCAPDEGFMQHWASLGPRLHALLDSGGTCVLTCLYGAGRSGLVAALLLIERGMAPDAAIAHVRAAFSEAVESKVQMRWLQALSPGRPAAP